jgi:hypothetical protein
MSSPEMQPQLLRIDVQPAGPMESQSGLQMLRPRIYGALLEAPGVERSRAVAAIVIIRRPTFMAITCWSRWPRGASPAWVSTRATSTTTRRC